MPVVDVDFDVAGVGAARLHEETAHGVTDLGRRGGEGAVCEADVEETEVFVGLVFFFFFFFFLRGQWVWGMGTLHLQACDGIPVWIGG